MADLATCLWCPTQFKPKTVGELRGVGYPNERLERVLDKIVEDVEIREVSGG